MKKAVLVAAAIVVSAACAGEPDVRADRFDLPGRASAVATSGDLVFVSDDQNDVVWVVGMDGEVVGEGIEVPPNPIAIAADSGTLWVAHAGGEVTPVDLETRQAGAPIAAGGSITGVAAGDGRVWVTDAAAAELVEIRGGVVAGRTRIDEGAVRVASGEGEVWVSNSESTVTKIDPTSGAAGPVVGVGTGPIGLAVAYGAVWVANSDDGTVSRIADGAVVTTHEIGGAPVAVAAGGGSVWVVTQDSLTLVRLDPATGSRLQDPLDLGLNPRGIAFGGGAVWVAGTNPSSLARVVPGGSRGLSNFENRF